MASNTSVSQLKMNVIDQNIAFQNKYESKCSSTFEAINKWADDANKLNDKYQGRLEPCECLETALTGELPDDFDNRQLVKLCEVRYVYRYIQAELTQIDDEAVKVSVKFSIEATIFDKNLVFKYRNNLSEGQRARVRIITRMLWNNLCDKKGTNDVRKLF